MIQSLPVGSFDWVKNVSKIDEDFIKNYDEDSDKRYILEVDVEYPKNYMICVVIYHSYQNESKLIDAASLYAICMIKKNYVVHIRLLKQTLNHGLILKNVHRVIQFNTEAWLKPYIDMNTELRKQAKNDFENDFYKLMNNCFCKNNGKCKEIQRY